MIDTIKIKVEQAIRQAFLEQQADHPTQVNWDVIADAAIKAVLHEITPKDPRRRAKVVGLFFEEAESRRAAMPVTT